MSELKILSYNTQGLGGIIKRKDTFDFFKEILTVTHFTDTEERPVLDLRIGECLFNNCRSNAREVSIICGNI